MSTLKLLQHFLGKHDRTTTVPRKPLGVRERLERDRLYEENRPSAIWIYGVSNDFQRQSLRFTIGPITSEEVATEWLKKNGFTYTGFKSENIGDWEREPGTLFFLDEGTGGLDHLVAKITPMYPPTDIALKDEEQPSVIRGVIMIE